MTEKLYYVVYRTGGTDNAQWHRSLPMNKATAEKSAQDVRAGGRKAIVVEKEASDKIGLPEGYEYKKS
jgi:hypothetical protein